MICMLRPMARSYAKAVCKMKQALLLVLCTILLGGHPVLLLEFFGEIAGAVKAGLIADIRDTFLGSDQHL